MYQLAPANIARPKPTRYSVVGFGLGIMLRRSPLASGTPIARRIHKRPLRAGSATTADVANRRDCSQQALQRDHDVAGTQSSFGREAGGAERVLLGQQLYQHVHGAPAWYCIDVRLNVGRKPAATDTTQVRPPGASDSARSFGRLSDATMGPLTRSSEPPIHRIAEPALHQFAVGQLDSQLRLEPRHAAGRPHESVGTALSASSSHVTMAIMEDPNT